MVIFHSYVAVNRRVNGANGLAVDSKATEIEWGWGHLDPSGMPKTLWFASQLSQWKLRSAWQAKLKNHPTEKVILWPRHWYIMKKSTNRWSHWCSWGQSPHFRSVSEVELFFLSQLCISQASHCSAVCSSVVPTATAQQRAIGDPSRMHWWRCRRWSHCLTVGLMSSLVMMYGWKLLIERTELRSTEHDQGWTI